MIRSDDLLNRFAVPAEEPNRLVSFSFGEFCPACGSSRSGSRTDPRLREQLRRQ
ncbi:Uncharacterised protein [Mycobacteroides abscessus subsp. abscessus]|nr:Uncharacterised protein [Mycobacteroides abscessus subsp. abscessus]